MKIKAKPSNQSSVSATLLSNTCPEFSSNSFGSFLPSIRQTAVWICCAHSCSPSWNKHLAWEHFLRRCTWTHCSLAFVHQPWDLPPWFLCWPCFLSMAPTCPCLKSTTPCSKMNTCWPGTSSLQAWLHSGRVSSLIDSQWKQFDLMMITFFSKRTMFKKETSTGERLPLTFGSLTSKVLQTVLMIFG